MVYFVTKVFAPLLVLTALLTASATSGANLHQDCDPKLVCSAVHAENKAITAQLRSLKKIEKELPRSELQESISVCDRERGRITLALDRTSKEAAETKVELRNAKRRVETLEKELATLRVELKEVHRVRYACQQRE